MAKIAMRNKLARYPSLDERCQVYSENSKDFLLKHAKARKSKELQLEEKLKKDIFTI